MVIMLDKKLLHAHVILLCHSCVMHQMSDLHLSVVAKIQMKY